VGWHEPTKKRQALQVIYRHTACGLRGDIVARHGWEPVSKASGYAAGPPTGAGARSEGAVTGRRTDVGRKRGNPTPRGKFVGDGAFACCEKRDSRGGRCPACRPQVLENVGPGPMAHKSADISQPRTDRNGQLATSFGGWISTLGSGLTRRKGLFCGLFAKGP